MFLGLERIQKTFFDPDIMWQTFKALVTVGLPNTILLAVLASVIGMAIGVKFSHDYLGLFLFPIHHKPAR